MYLVVVEKAENNYGAYAPDVPGCVSTGATVEETLRNFQEALEFHLEGTLEGGEPLPEPYAVEAQFLEVQIPDTEPAHSSTANRSA
jgi:predicted RNase H-like HicB family nuclease